jgi:3-oxoacyl-[acyl-carrier-protein] synthase II
MAIKKIFGAHAGNIVISANKSMLGHLLGAAGGVEVVASCLMIHHGIIPPTINYEEPDPACDLNYCPNKAQKKDVRYVLKNSFGFGGTNASLVLGAPDAA